MSCFFCGSNPGWSRSGIIFSQLRGPKEEVVSEQLHNESCILVVLVLHTVQVCDCFIEGRASHCTSLLRVLRNLVVEDGVIERKSELQRMRVAQRLSGLPGGFFIGSERLLGNRSALFT